MLRSQEAANDYAPDECQRCEQHKDAHLNDRVEEREVFFLERVHRGDTGRYDDGPRNEVRSQCLVTRRRMSGNVLQRVLADEKRARATPEEFRE